MAEISLGEAKNLILELLYYAAVDSAMEVLDSATPANAGQETLWEGYAHPAASDKLNEWGGQWPNVKSQEVYNAGVDSHPGVAQTWGDTLQEASDATEEWVDTAQMVKFVFDVMEILSAFM